MAHLGHIENRQVTRQMLPGELGQWWRAIENLQDFARALGAGGGADAMVGADRLQDRIVEVGGNLETLTPVPKCVESLYAERWATYQALEDAYFALLPPSDPAEAMRVIRAALDAEPGELADLFEEQV